MINASIKCLDFTFKRPATTSRGTLLSKRVYFIALVNEEESEVFGVGECSLFPGLSFDDVDGFKNKLTEVVDRINRGEELPKTFLTLWPSISFALETARLDLQKRGSKILFPSDFTEGKNPIAINGLIWMGPKDEMQKQIRQKLDNGFKCLKLKIGALSFEEEYSIVCSIRKQFKSSDLELRVDANGAFSPAEAPRILDMLFKLQIHSIEQPIKAGQQDAMAALCKTTPIPIALDEELIGIQTIENKRRLLETIKPQFIILKPGLLGGLSACDEWIAVAEEMGIRWWVTSSLETNIGLNAIAQWTFTLNNNVCQGLSTGNLFEANIPSPLSLVNDKLYYDVNNYWDLSMFKWGE